MRLNRFAGNGYSFETMICAFGKAFGKGYFVAFKYPFFNLSNDLLHYKTKPRFRNIYALSALLLIPYIVTALVGLLFAACYVLYTVLGGYNVVNAIKESRELGGFINLVSIFCVVFFYLAGIVATVMFLVW